MRDPVLHKLAALGLHLPPPPRPAGHYLAVMRAGSLLYVSAQLPFVAGQLQHVGQVGRDLTLEQGKEAAVTTALNVLSQLHGALGSFEHLASLVFVEGHVASASTFTDQPRVLDGASQLFHEVLGERSGHARSAFAPPQLPLSAPVMLVARAQIRS